MGAIDRCKMSIHAIYSSSLIHSLKAMRSLTH